MAEHSRQELDLTGQRFGMLTVLAPAENIGGRTAWLCRCDCGQETVVMTGHLRDGHTTSCGCKPPVTLIDGTCVELIQAKTIRRNNTSGVTGVTRNNQQNRWDATLMFKGKRYYLGGYGRFEDAVKARRRAEEELYEPFLREFAEAQSQSANEDQCSPLSRESLKDSGSMIRELTEAQNHGTTRDQCPPYQGGHQRAVGTCYGNSSRRKTMVLQTDLNPPASLWPICLD